MVNQKIVNAATKFRNALEQCYSELGGTFEAFPAGTCGETSHLLGTYLIDNQLGDFEYIFGTYGCKADGTYTTHAWLRSGVIIVDITADQFNDVTSKVIVRNASPWHEKFDQESQGIADYRIDAEENIELSQSKYERIIAQIRAT